MDFYVLRVLLPALLIDIVLTLNLQKYNNIFAGKLRKLINALAGSPLYLMSAFAWALVYGQDPRFQGQGALGLAVFLGLGVAFSIVRFLLGAVVFIL